MRKSGGWKTGGGRRVIKNTIIRTAFRINNCPVGDRGFTVRTGGQVPDIKNNTALEGGTVRALGMPGPWEHGSVSVMYRGAKREQVSASFGRTGGSVERPICLI